MALEFELAGSQIDGARDYQEDAFLITNLADANGKPAALVVVADGMGGHAAGNVASNMAVQAFNKHVSANYPSDNIAEILEQSVVKANNSIKETVTETPALAGMGCTMVAAIFEEGKVTWASVGDSHLYLVRNRELTKINADHSYGGFLDRMEAAGTPVEPEPGLSRNMLMSAVTGEDINEIDVPSEPFELQAGDRIIVCSDGLDTLSSGKIIQYSEWSESPKECADALMQAVEDANMPRQDNTTAIVVNIKDSAAVPAKPEPEPVTEDVGESTAELPVVEAQSAEVTTEPISEPVQEEFETFEEPKSKTGMFIGIAAAVLIAVGIGAFFMMGKKSSGTSEPAVVEMETVEETVPDAGEEPVVEEAKTGVESKVDETTAKEAIASSEPSPVKTAPKSPAAATEKTFQDDLKSGGKGPLMVWIPAGDYEMGSNKEPNEAPKHKVSIRKIAVSEKEITFSEYNKYASSENVKLPNTKGLDPETFPAFFVSWDNAYNYTKWLSRETGKRYRLLSEAEWEYAASGGKHTPFWWGYNMEPNKAHCFLGCNQQYNTNIPMKVGSFDPNPFGLYDTSGNVAEWVHDCWHKNYKEAPSDGSVWEGGDCTQRVVRGGSFTSPEQSLRTSFRDKFKSSASYEFIGFRVAREE